MSLNWREIDAVIAELDLPGSFVQQVIQPDFRNLYLEIFRPGNRFFLRICLETGRTRLHATDRRPAKPRTRQRFAQLLHSRITGAHVTGARQVNADRIVRIDLERADERTLLWIRLWGGAANCLATDEHGTIIDAFFRRPGRGEISGGTFYVKENDEDPNDDPKLAAFQSRWARDVNESVRTCYAALEADEAHRQAIERAETVLRTQATAARRRLRDLERKLGEEANGERLRELGDIILANLHRTAPGDRWLEAEDFTRGNNPIRIELDPGRSPQENAAAYYDRASKAKRRAVALSEEVDNLRRRLERIDHAVDQLGNRSTDELRRVIEEHAPARAPTKDESTPGLQFESGGFRILVGRNARENDELLRRHVRGNDLWLHTRDYPGGYVFVKAKRNKSVPLDVMLDAGNLAVHYSKAKSNGRADLYYTQVKFLRRAKEGPRGLVIPTQEKNLHVIVDEARLARLLR